MARSALSVAELAEMTGVSLSTIYLELEQTGQVMGVQAFKIRRRWVLPRRLIEDRLGVDGDTTSGRPVGTERPEGGHGSGVSADGVKGPSGARPDHRNTNNNAASPSSTSGTAA